MKLDVVEFCVRPRKAWPPPGTEIAQAGGEEEEERDRLRSHLDPRPDRVLGHAVQW